MKENGLATQFSAEKIFLELEIHRSRNVNGGMKVYGSFLNRQDFLPGLLIFFVICHKLDLPFSSNQ